MPIENTLADRWCRMWNDDPELAHELLTADGRQWSGRSPGLDDLVGPAAAASFCTFWRSTKGLRFTPRLIVADGADRLAYTWDAALPDGTVLTGMDVNVLVDGRVAENWTVSAGRRATAADPAPEPTGRDVLERLAHAWTARGNGEADPGDLVTDDVTVVTGVADGATQLTGREASAADVGCSPSLAVHRGLVVDPERGRVAGTWTATTDGGPVGVLTLLTARGGRIASAWSIVGDRPFTY